MFIKIRKYVKHNLIKDEPRSLTTWTKDVLFNLDRNLLLRPQEEVNRYVVFDKETDIAKVNYQIERSSFIKLNYNPCEKFALNIKQ